MRDWWLRTRLDLWAQWCKIVGHRWEVRQRDGRMCKRCWEYQPSYKQHFGHVKISGPKPYDQSKHD